MGRRAKDNWRLWREDFTDYCELTINGMGKELERARAAKEAEVRAIAEKDIKEAEEKREGVIRSC